MTKFRPIDFMKRHKVLSGLIIFLLVLVLAYGIPPLVGDGTGRFAGAEQRVARAALQGMYGVEDPMVRHVNMIWAFQFYVEDVQKMSPQEAKACKPPQGADMTGYYHVKMSQVTIFGIRTNYFENFFESCIASEKIKNNP